jgi:hypothetical protein
MTDWNNKEKLFTAITWCPKATVQAALSTVALEYVHAHAAEFGGKGSASYLEAESWATKLKTVAILSIIATAPLFAALMDWGGYNLLQPSVEPVAPAPNGILVLQSKEEHVMSEEDHQVDKGKCLWTKVRMHMALPHGTAVVQKASGRERIFSKQYR